jgi:hypothetical protein
VGKKEKKLNERERERERERALARKYFLRISINLICLSTHNSGLKEANFTMKLIFF